MSDITLAQLLAILQDNLQRSYEYAEDLAALGRTGGDLSVTMALTEFEVEIPISTSIQERSLDFGDAISNLSSASSFELAGLNLITPMNAGAVREVIAAEAIRASRLERDSALASKQTNPQSVSEKDTRQSGVKTTAASANDPNRIRDILSTTLKEVSSDRRRFTDAFVTVISGDAGSKPIGVLRAKFKTTLK